MKTTENGWVKDGIVHYLHVNGIVRGSVLRLGAKDWSGNYFTRTGTLHRLPSHHKTIAAAKRAVRVLVK